VGSTAYLKINKIHIFIIFLFFIVVLERTPLAAMIISSFVTIILWGSKKRKVSLRIFSIIGVVLISLLFTNIIVPKLDILNVREKRLAELGDIRNASNLQARINRWERASSYIWSPKILIGYGLGFYAGDLSYSAHRGMHNEIYNQLIEYGFIGLIILFLVYRRILKQVNSQNKNLLLPFLSGILTFWIIAQVNSPFLNNTKYYHWFLIGCITTISAQNKRQFSLEQAE